MLTDRIKNRENTHKLLGFEKRCFNELNQWSFVCKHDNFCLNPPFVV